MRVIHEEGVMALRGIDFRVGHSAAVGHQRLHDFARALGREAPVGGEAHQQKARLRRRQPLRQIAAGGARRVEIVERAGDEQIGVGVEIAAEFVALVAQIALDLEVHAKAVAQSAIAQRTAEFGGHGVVAEIGDVPDHARHRQTLLGHDAVGVVVAAVKVGVGDDGAARHLVEGDVLRRKTGRCGDSRAVGHAAWMAQRPAQRLHAAQAAADDRSQALDAQPVEQPRLRIDPIFDRHHGETAAPRLASGGVEAHRAGGAEARTGIVGAQDEKALGVERFAGADQVVPPAYALGVACMRAGGVMAGVERMTHQHGVAALGVERAVGFIHQLVGGQLRAALKRQRLLERHALRRDVTEG